MTELSFVHSTIYGKVKGLLPLNLTEHTLEIIYFLCNLMGLAWSEWNNIEAL